MQTLLCLYIVSLAIVGYPLFLQVLLGSLRLFFILVGFLGYCILSFVLVYCPRLFQTLLCSHKLSLDIVDFPLFLYSLLGQCVLLFALIDSPWLFIMYFFLVGSPCLLYTLNCSYRLSLAILDSLLCVIDSPWIIQTLLCYYRLSLAILGYTIFFYALHGQCILSFVLVCPGPTPLLCGGY